MNVAPSNLEAARSQVQKSNAEIDAKMPGWIRNAIPAASREKIAALQEKALQQQADFYRKTEDEKH